MNFIKKLLLITLLSYASALWAQPVTYYPVDYSSLNFYKNISIPDSTGKTVFKYQYQYLNTLELDSFRYLSDGLQVKGYLLRPKGKTEKLPLIIFNRGGNRDYGNLTPAMLIYNLSKIASQGYIVAGSTYRGNKDSEGKDEFGGSDVNDIINLLNLLNKEAFVDSTRTAFFGWSRGGMMTYLALARLRQNTCIKTAIVGGAASDLFKTIEERPEMETKVFREIIPGYATQKEAALQERSAVYWAAKLSPKVPLLLLHGRNDSAVSVTQTLNLAQKLTQHTIPYKLVVYEDEAHNIHNNKEELDTLILGWLKKYL